MKKIVSTLLVLTIVFMSSAAAFAYENPYKRAAKDFANRVEAAAEKYADAVESKSEEGPQNPLDYVKNIFDLTGGFFKDMFVK